jgi:hypothetical protein
MPAPPNHLLAYIDPGIVGILYQSFYAAAATFLATAVFVPWKSMWSAVRSAGSWLTGSRRAGHTGHPTGEASGADAPATDRSGDTNGG